MKLRTFACLSAALVCIPALATAQTSPMFSNLANPAIGMNALFSGQGAHNLDGAYGLQFDEAEISLISVVDPYWTFTGNIVFAPEEVDPEEVWVRSTNIPSLQLKLGKLRGTFGKHGLLHTHAFPFVQAPIVMANTIGEEGFKDAGAEAAWLTPLPWFSELTGGVYQAIPADGGQPLDFGSTQHDNVPFLGHFKNQFDLNDATTLEIGQSLLQGRGTDEHRHAAYGADVTVRNVPPRSSNQHGWILQSEYLQKGSRAGGSYAREPVAGLVGRHSGRASPQELHRLSDRRHGRFDRRQGEPRVRERRVDALGVLVRETRVQPFQSGRRCPPDRRPAHDPDELHDRLSPGPCVLKRCPFRSQRRQEK